MYKCKKCNIIFENKPSKYASGEFCSKKCAKSYSTKNDNKNDTKVATCNKCNMELIVNKRTDINKCLCKKCKQHKKICIYCNNIFYTRLKKQKHCSRNCMGKTNWKNDKYRKTLTSSIKNRCKNINERIRLKEIGRFGGFGTKGYTIGGTYFESNFEKKCFEFLENKKVPFVPHKQIPNSSKVSDLYLPNEDLWIELDGINREQRKKWLGKNYQNWTEKIELYEKEKLNMKIYVDFKSFSEDIEKLSDSL